jgi:hypothetical protein
LNALKEMFACSVFEISSVQQGKVLPLHNRLFEFPRANSRIKMMVTILEGVEGREIEESHIDKFCSVLFFSCAFETQTLFTTTGSEMGTT